MSIAQSGVFVYDKSRIVLGRGLRTAMPMVWCGDDIVLAAVERVGGISESLPLCE